MHVEEHHVGLVLAGDGDSRIDIVGLRDDVEAADTGELSDHACAGERVIIDDDDSHD